MRLHRTLVPAAALSAAILLASLPSGAVDLIDGRIQIHGYFEEQLRALGDDFHAGNANVSQWANVLNIEVESDIAPNGFGPFDMISAFSRISVRYDCIYSGCGVLRLPTYRYYGDKANRVPRNYATGRETGYSGVLPIPDESRDYFHRNGELLTVYETPLLKALADLGAPNLRNTFGPVEDATFAVKDIGASIGNGTFTLGPWTPDAEIDPSGSLDTVADPTLPLPLRPALGAPKAGGMYPHGLFVPSQKYLERVDDVDGFQDIEQNYTQADLALNHVQSQDERELKEAYIEAEMFDGRLWLRLGKQNIVWGKTELFRTTDQFNPQTLALSSLPSLEESRIALWSARGTWSFYDIGPLEDVRLELAVNLDDFEPLDLGRCGTPYTVWLVCGKTFGYWGHGLAGAGIAGEDRPPNWWESVKGLEFGGRLEFRWDRFSFQISDFWGYQDAPTIDLFNEYERKVDPDTGQPLDVNGKPLLGQSDSSILAHHPVNRQLFSLACSATQGIAADLYDGGLIDRCLVDIVNADFQVLPGVPTSAAFSAVLGGSPAGNSVLSILSGGAAPPAIRLNRDPGDGTGSGPFNLGGLSAVLTDEQEALLGCGRFYGTSCDIEGIDLFNAEASVLVQSFPQFEKGGPVATRYVPGRGLVVLPGARGPSYGRGYDAYVDGCVEAGPDLLGCNAGDPGRVGPSARMLVDPTTGEVLRNELAAVSYNFLYLVAGLGVAGGTDPDCDPADPFTCELVRGVLGIAGIRRPEVRAGGNGDFGRRDFIWSGGSEIQLRYQKRNVLGFATDFAEDRTKTNWSVEGTWIHGEPFAVTSELHGYDRFETYNLTVSVDRPTFINFLNPNRTFFLNSQVFLRFIQDYVGDDRMGVHGPFSALWTVSVFTGYFQDRLLPGVTWVHDAFSMSGGLVGQISYRFTENFSATFGVAAFYGKPDELQSPGLRPILVANGGGDYKALTRYDGLSAIAERDELFLIIRYTF